jgi:hypothetical protein
MGLFHTVNSAVNNKKGVISIAFIACREVLPDPEFYADCITASFAELQAATERKPKAAKKKAARKPVKKRAKAGKVA